MRVCGSTGAKPDEAFGKYYVAWGVEKAEAPLSLAPFSNLPQFD